MAFLLLPGPVLAAGFSCAQPDTADAPPFAGTQLAELDEVVVTPRQVVHRARDLGTWLKRLEGQYRYEGHVDLCGQGRAADQRPVVGEADCFSITRDPDNVPLRGLYCVIDVRWPQVRDENGAVVMGGESRLSPAVAIYGVAPDLPGIQVMQLDNKGIATHAKGQLTGNTLITRASCGTPDDCQRVTRITAHPDSEDISMLIDMEIGSRRVLRHAFLLHRISNIQMPPSKQNLRSVGAR